MLIALARKLIVALWRFVETGLVPIGAILSEPLDTQHIAAAA
jgi:hypothetical protein